MPEKITIIGAGPGGYVAALRASALGAAVTLIEKESVGGTCLNWGCIPSKIMKTTADLLLKFKEAEIFGIKGAGHLEPDMTVLMERKHKIINSQQQGILSLLKKSNVRFVKGRGRIKGPGVIGVTDNLDVEEEIGFGRLILATGTRPTNVKTFPFNGTTILSSDHLLSLKEVPDSILIVGGGVIGCEFAFILAALGASVTIVEAMERLLPIESVDEACSKILLREMKKKKIKVILDRAVISAETGKHRVLVTIAPSPFSTMEKEAVVEKLCIDVAAMAVCLGRSPLSEDLGLDAIGLETDQGGWIPVDNNMETRVKGVYAIGDITGPARIMLAHVATREGIIAAENAMGADLAMDYHAVPHAIFTMPEIGCVGLSERGAIKLGIETSCSTVNFRILGKAQVMGEIAGEAKIVADKKTGRILGIHMIGPHATDLIAEGTLAVAKGLMVSDMAETIHAHPTLSEIMSELALKEIGKALHG